jgi:hypothetical protein
MVVKKTKLIKIIKSYEDLKNSKVGELILIEGRAELIINGEPSLGRFKDNQNKISTLSIEGEYVVKNYYRNCIESYNSHLAPFKKISCRKYSDTALESKLSTIAREGGLL